MTVCSFNDFLMIFEFPRGGCTPRVLGMSVMLGSSAHGGGTVATGGIYTGPLQGAFTGALTGASTGAYRGAYRRLQGLPR